MTTRATTRDVVARKLSPDRVLVSGKFTALLGFLLDEQWTDPQITALTITSEGGMLDTSSGFANEFIGSVDDLDRNIDGVAKVAGLTESQTLWLHRQVRYKSSDWRRA